MRHTIRETGAKQLIGMRKEMSFARNTTQQLWQEFMPRKKEIEHIINTDLYSLQVYPTGFYKNFDPQRIFEKWALVEVSQIGAVPTGMETFNLPAGLYAVFDYKGAPAAAEPAYRYIFMEWLPASGYKLDSRPHFEILGEKYKHNQEDSEEEIWIPVSPI